MSRNSSQTSPYTVVLLTLLMMGIMITGGVAVMLLFYNVAVGVAAFGGIGIAAALIFKRLLKTPEGPVQELKIIVDLPAGTEAEVAPLLLNTVDSELFSFLLKRCTQTVDQGQILLHYKRRGEIYDPQQKAFRIKDAFYRPTRLKVVYYRLP